ncbi:MAG TPA: T9SS type A sorting domain-containing protein, partial [Paludibacteraceae bacterium]|nr:T9SS type A sorting domain-containing protein [Paludibacteraceae bacterium]
INAIKEESVKIKNSCETSDTESAPSNEQVIVYPSPIEDEFTIVEDNSYKISIYDTTGKLIHNKLAYGTTKIDCKNWGKGIYHIIVAKNGDVKQSSILK